MSQIIRCSEDRIQELFSEMIDWSYVKRVEITKTADGVVWVKIIHYRPGKYMFHALKRGWKNGDGLS